MKLSYVMTDTPVDGKEIKQFIEQKNRFHKRIIWSNKTLLCINQFRAFQEEISFLVEKSTNDYYSKLSQKLRKKTTSSKAYSSILKTFLNNKKIPMILPLFHNNKLVIDFREKAELFNTIFAQQFTTKWATKKNCYF